MSQRSNTRDDICPPTERERVDEADSFAREGREVNAVKQGGNGEDNDGN